MKKVADEDCWFGAWERDYPINLIKKMNKFKIPDSEYSFEGETQKDAYILKKTLIEEKY